MRTHMCQYVGVCPWLSEGKCESALGETHAALLPASASLLARYQGERGKLAGEVLPVAFGSVRLARRKLQETAAAGQGDVPRIIAFLCMRPEAGLLGVRNYTFSLPSASSPFLRFLISFSIPPPPSFFIISLLLLPSPERKPPKRRVGSAPWPRVSETAILSCRRCTSPCEAPRKNYHEIVFSGRGAVL